MMHHDSYNQDKVHIVPRVEKISSREKSNGAVMVQWLRPESQGCVLEEDPQTLSYLLIILN